ncbi:MAG: MBL fold metallo-hydrolase [Rhizobiales bacterium]|nr:MBL fold metallo-hydrolase [Hyphomicrobiales bacterium]
MAVSPITRRTLLAGTASTAAALSLPFSEAAASSPATSQAPSIYRYKLGDYELTAIHDGVWNRKIDASFVRGAAWSDVQKAMADAYMPEPGTLPIPFTALLVNTGAKLLLIDTGSGGQMTATAGSLVDNLAAAGVKPKDIDTIAISHFHPDHINGIKTKDDALVFSNAEIMVPADELRFFMDDGNLSRASDSVRGVFLNARRVFKTIEKTVTPFTPGKEIVLGVTPLAAPGHTPGHVVFALASGNASMMVLSDTTNRPELFARHPEWQPVFDMDGPLAVANRKHLLDRVSADRMLVQSYYFPFPACGHIARDGAGYAYVPSQWNPTL